MSDLDPVGDLAIEVRGLTKRYGPTLALDSADLDVRRGEFAAIVGPSGSGKSTLLHLLAALETADSGSIRVNGHTLGHTHGGLSSYRRNEIGLVFQLHNLIPRLTAQQNVEIAMFGAHRNHRDKHEHSSAVLELVGLGDKLRSKPPELSGGERQRVAVARALANDPPIVFADEPTGSLDDYGADQLLNTFERMRRDLDVTILAVSHDARLTERADRLVQLVEGHILDGTLT
jgi:ABC-type lipoprotein export system ATPase subunit